MQGSFKVAKMYFTSMISFNPFEVKTVIPSLQMKELQFKEFT